VKLEAKEDVKQDREMQLNLRMDEVQDTEKENSLEQEDLN
jgi:hypothetical protein